MADERGRETPVDDYLIDKPLDLNAASRDDLRIIKGLGEGRADRIVEWREKNGPFRNVDELQQVPQMTPDVLRAVRSQLKV